MGRAKESEDRANKGVKVTYNGLIVNIILTAFKFLAGIIGQSAAMVADAAHSLSDLASDVVVILCFRYIKNPIDETHNYGHGKIETLSTAIVGSMLLVVIFFIASSSVEELLRFFRGEVIPRPAPIALIAAILSITSKELLYRYTLKVGKEIKSPLIIANAWHHRSDAFSSIGTMIGIGGAIFLGEKWRILDPLAALFVSVLILKVAIDILKDSVSELIETSVDDKLKNEIFDTVSKVKGVKDYHKLRIRRIGNYYSMSLHILVDKSMTVKDAHDISYNVEEEIRKLLGPETIVTTHLEPYD
ncbi:MAG TPA: cation diffusion facilitator family transporter [Methanofastidiosum sp.]|nr:cation diffusion facilitator family transporter [Methanofastidiosum sp.]HOR88488.1 cation diffusion facilitator family transporter [Methanofastidiosum sp.]HPL00212.1 cation diffusion facilitator family transporter [Methanofastidiosum sp.]